MDYLPVIGAVGVSILFPPAAPFAIGAAGAYYYFKDGENSAAESTSEQKSKVYITQQFSGTCDISCTNIMGNVAQDFINSNIEGDIKLTQTCSTNGSCLIGSNENTVADVLFSAKNSSNAENAMPLSRGAKSEGRQTIKTNIRQTSNQTCNTPSYNQIGDISLLAVNSNVGGSVITEQVGNTSGKCQLNNSIEAASKATGHLTEESKDGKDKKAGKFKIITWIIIAFVVLFLVYGIAYIISNRTSKKSKPGSNKPGGSQQGTTDQFYKDMFNQTLQNAIQTYDPNQPQLGIPYISA